MGRKTAYGEGIREGRQHTGSKTAYGKQESNLYREENMKAMRHRQVRTIFEAERERI